MANDTFYAAWRSLPEIEAHLDWLRSTAAAGLRVEVPQISSAHPPTPQRSRPTRNF